MICGQSTTVKQFRRILIQLPQLLVLDGRTKEAKRKEAQRRLLICMATDEELKQMAKLIAEVLPEPVDEILKNLKELKEEHTRTKESWQKYLGEPKQ